MVLPTSLFFRSYRRFFAKIFANHASIKNIYTIVTHVGTRRSRLSSYEGLKESISKKTLDKVLNKLKSRVEEPSFRDNKLGGPGYTVRMDQIMMNLKCKIHRGRSHLNLTDALCIVEVNQNDHITREFVKVIPDKKSTTIISIILKNSI